VQEGESEELEDANTEHFAQPFAFSALFQSSRSSPGLSILRGTPTYKRPSSATNLALDTFVGFSWGPRLNAFNPPEIPPKFDQDATPRPALHREPVELTPRPSLPLRATDPLPLPQSVPASHAFRTPVRTGTLPVTHAHTISIPRTGTARRMQGRRPVSDREAMQQLVDSGRRLGALGRRKKSRDSCRFPNRWLSTPARMAICLQRLLRATRNRRVQPLGLVVQCPGEAGGADDPHLHLWRGVQRLR